MRTLTASIVAVLSIHCAAPVELESDELGVSAISIDEEEPLAPGQHEATAVEMLAADVAEYARGYGVTQPEARRRVLAMRAVINELEALRAQAPREFDAAYAGRVTTHQPFAMRASFKGAVPSNGRARLVAAGATVDVAATESELEREARVDQLADAFAARFPVGEFEISAATDGSVDLTFLPTGTMTPMAVLQFVAGTRIRPVAAARSFVPVVPPVADEPAVESDDLTIESRGAAAPACPLHGGRRLYVSIASVCTAGFGGAYCFPRGPNGCVPAMVTAAHCGGGLNYPFCSEPVSLRRMESNNGKYGDIQTVRAQTPRVKRSALFQLDDDGTLGAVTSVRTSIGRGDIASKYGKTTGRTGIEITKPTTRTRSSDGKLRKRLTEYKAVTSTNPGDGGDSGGPVFVGNAALGLIQGSYDDRNLGYFTPLRNMGHAVPNTVINLRR